MQDIAFWLRIFILHDSSKYLNGKAFPHQHENKTYKNEKVCRYNTIQERCEKLAAD